MFSTSCYLSVYYFLQLCNHIDILTAKVWKFQKGRKNFLHFGEAISKKAETKFPKVEGDKKDGKQRLFEKIGGKNLPRRTLHHKKYIILMTCKYHGLHIIQEYSI